MARELNIEIVESETIKPSSPTPIHNKSFSFSLFDQFAPASSIRILLFFPNTSTCKTDQGHNQSKLLKKSLSQTLTSFYPFAGRIRENAGIDCTDEGAEFVETRVKCPVSTIMEKPDPELLNQLVPSYTVLSNEEIGKAPLLLVQANFFGCGGMAIGVSLSHKVADAWTVCKFVNCWAANTSESGIDSSLSPQFLSPPLLAPHESLASLPSASAQPFPAGKIAVRRLLFSGRRISDLRSKLASPTVRNPTRVEAVLALIWRSAMEASRSSNSSGTQTRQSVLLQMVNLRKRLTVALPENSCGNFSWRYAVKCRDAHEAEPHNLVAKYRKGIEEFKESCDIRTRREGLSQDVEEYQKLIRNGDTDIYMATSRCRFPFYQVDFGWGNPSWVCVPSILKSKNAIMIMDSRDNDDGIEVLMSLGEEEMAYFERDPELLHFASVYPSAV